MKKVQRNFVIEYKSGRRNADHKPTSIWGNMDLKSVARELEKEAAPFLTPHEDNHLADSEAFSPKAEGRGLLLTQSIKRPTTAANTQEITMADENETTTNNEAPTSLVAAVDVPKKQRKPRSKEATPETASAEVAAEAAPVKKTRGRKPKLNGDVSSAKSAPVRRGPKPVQAANGAPKISVDEMTEILQLEEENQRLRKLLAEKLRADNADLRKRLNLG